MITYKKVEAEEGMKKIAHLATIIWEEHYGDIIGMDQVNYMLSRFQSLEAIKRQIQEECYIYYLMSDKDNGVGYMALIEQEEQIFLSKLYIDKRYRNKGIASEAFKLMEERCKEKGYRKIWLTVNRDNKESIDIYLKKGFIKVREEKKDIGNGFVMDDYIMEKIID